MTLYTHRAERTDLLADGLAEVLRTPLPDPFATEVVAVPTPGVERWLAQRLAHRLGADTEGRGDGVCAGVGFVPMRRLVAQVRGDALDLDPDEDPWRTRRLAWTVLAELDAVAGEPWAAPVADYLGLRRERHPGEAGGEHRLGRRFATARRIAGLFDRYAVQRPGLIARWIEGADTDAQGEPLAADRAWQPRLWRRLRERIGQPSPAERLDHVCELLDTAPERIDLPQRVSVFGATRMTREQVRVLAALGRHRDVHLWLPQPSSAQWEAVAATLHADDATHADHTARLGPRRSDPATAAARHPLLAYLARDARELQETLALLAPEAQDDPLVSDAPRPDTLLGRLQAGLAGDDPGAPVPLSGDDTSVAVHAAHGPDRQVEVLRDVLVGLLADDPTLEPRDIVVMCPDIETFAPLLTAAFGLGTREGDESAADHPGHRLRVRLADRSLRQVNPLLGLAAELLDLARGRLTASRVLDLCAAEPVMRKFGLTDIDLARITDLVTRSGVRWGLDASHRARFGMDGFAHNTWQTGLDRLALGVTMDGTGEHAIGTVLPMDDVDAGDVELLGRLAELIARLTEVLDSLTGVHPLPYWMGVLRDALDALTAVAPDQSWQPAHALSTLDRLAEGSPETDPPPVRLADVRALLADIARGRASRANFRTGTLTIATMLPMRSVPHRVVCLLGVDDGVFPRRTAEDGDDLLAAEPYVGDHDPRSEDRQLLLDALMAAEERLVLIYSGKDPRTNEPRPPAVPVGAVLDTIDRIATTPDGRPARTALTTEHRLQPFDPHNFVRPTSAPDAGRDQRSFDRTALAGARALLCTPREPEHQPWRLDPDRPLPPVPADEPVTLDDLRSFFTHPLRMLVRKRAGLYVREEEDEDDDAIPIAPDGLQRWAIADRMLRLRLRGLDTDAVIQAEWRRGAVPPRSLGAAMVQEAAGRVEQVLKAAQPWLGATPDRLEVDVELPGARVTGTLPRVYDDTLLTIGVSWVGAKQRLRAWVELLAATAAHPDRPWRAVVLGKGSRCALGPVPAGFAATVLDDLCGLYRDGLRAPIPFAAGCSADYAHAARTGVDEPQRLHAAEKSWSYDKDELYERFFGAQLSDLAAEPRREDEVRGSTDAASRFGVLAWRVFFPIQQAAA